MALKNFNRIITLTLYKAVGHVTIRCPLKGRKPSIEINGTFTAANYLPAFNLTVKNLYIDLQGEQYTKLKVEAGYEGDTVTFEGTILTIYQDEPGPESKLVIQCQMGKLQNWLDATVQLDYAAGTPLKTVLDDISGKLKTSGVHAGLKAGTLMLKNNFMFDGSARNALAELEKIYTDENLALFVRGNVLCAVCVPGGDFVKTHVLQYMSAPPQENTGDEAGTYYTTVTAPWIPKLQIGDLLTIPSRVYMRNFMTVGGKSKTQNIQVTGLSFHFGTTGGTNSMQVQGFIKR